MRPELGAPPEDARGLALWRRRLDGIPDGLRAVCAAPPRPGPAARRWIATGVGSSEAHARFLVALANRWGGPPAEFRPLSAFLEPAPPSEGRLVLFSQGLSANARLALDRRGDFSGLTLFTSATEAGLRRAGRAERADCLAALEAEGAEIVPFPLEQEYEILIRVVGPACGFLAARQWAAGHPGVALPPTSAEQVIELWNDAVSRAPAAEFLALRGAAARGFCLLSGPWLADAAFNLACKFVEGVFWPAPAMSDLLAFAHGPFQQLAVSPRPVVALVREEPVELDLAERASVMCRSVGAPFLAVRWRGCPTLAPIEAEALFNPVVAALAEALGVDQREWPGKGLDAPLYAYP